MLAHINPRTHRHVVLTFTVELIEVDIEIIWDSIYLIFFVLDKNSPTKCVSYKINDDDDMFVAMKRRTKTTTTPTKATASETC